MSIWHSCHRYNMEDTMADMKYAVELRNVSKTFGNFKANDCINLAVRPGEVHGLLGENGAGKSTLMNILYGLLQPDAGGEIFVNGEKVHIKGPKQAMDLGIQMVHQHFMLAKPYKGWENVILGTEPTKNKIFIDIKKAKEEVARAAETCGFHIDSDMLVEDMPIAARQKLEIVRALYRKCDILILDEPSAVLSAQESEELMGIIKRLKAEGKAIILITHKLREAMEVCDEVTVLRKGQVVANEKIENCSVTSLAVAMVGRPVLFELPERNESLDEVSLSFKNVTTGEKKSDLKDVCFDVKKGEVLGIAGVEGNGQKKMVDAILGLAKVHSGSIELLGKTISNTHTMDQVSKIAHIAEDRHTQGYLNEFNIMENILVGRENEARFRKSGFMLNKKFLNDYCEEIVKDYDVRIPSLRTKGGNLSGGNQQKLVVGREFSRENIDFVIAEQPSRGLDISASEYVRSRIIDIRNAGKGCILITADLDELISVSDRVAVLYEGKVVAIGPASEFDEIKLGMYMTGGKLDE